MTQTLHIVRKDARRLRWVLALWFVVLAGRVALSASMMTLAGNGGDTELFFREVAGAFVTTEVLLMALIAVRLVHEEPLVGFNAFWLTRPYSKRALVFAKLFFAAVALLALPLAADLVTMALLRAGAPALALGGAAAAIALVTSILPLMVMAVLTPSLGVFVLAIVGIIAGMSVLLSALAGIATFWADDAPTYTTPGAPDATPALVALVVFISGALAVIVYQYRQRRWRRAVALVLAVLVVTVMVPGYWPWPFLRAEEIQPGGWAESASVVHDASWGTEVIDVARFGRSRPRRQINARVTLTGEPSDVGVQSVGVRARLQLDGGTVIESSQRGGFTERNRTPIIQAALGDVKLLAPVDFGVPSEAWTPMITLTEDDYLRYRGRTGRLDATIDFQMVRTRETATLPLRPGAAIDRGSSRVEIASLLRRTDSLGITMRQWRARAPLSTAAPVTREFALRNRARGEALPAGVENGWPIAGRGNGLINLMRVPAMAMGYGVGFSLGEGPGFSAGVQFLRFPSRGSGKAVQVDPSWYDGAELVVLERAPAGIVTKSLTIENFMIPMK